MDHLITNYFGPCGVASVPPTNCTKTIALPSFISLPRTRLIMMKPISHPFIISSQFNFPFPNNHGSKAYLQEAYHSSLTSHNSDINQRYLERWQLVKGSLEMCRLHNVPPSMGLVLLGSWVEAGHNMWKPCVWMTALCTALIAMASMLCNDIFDYRSGTDNFNGRITPLQSGQLHPHHVELVGGCLYGVAMLVMCCLEPIGLRLLVAQSALITYIYTPMLKKLTFMKNIIVSLVVSSSVLAGALATCEGGRVRSCTLSVALFVFLCILGRELLMDVKDIKGDKATGVQTVPVVYGPRYGAIAASLCLLAANALLISKLLASRVPLVYATLGTLSLLPLHAKMIQLMEGIQEHTKEENMELEIPINALVKQSMFHIGMGLIILAKVV